jgi:hypothetical protein
MNLQENIQRIREMMNLNELGGSVEDYNEWLMRKEREKNPYTSKEYNPENETDFSNSKVKDVVWRAGELMNFNKGGGIWFAENKEDTEKFAMSVRGEKRTGKPYYINLENPYYYDSFWGGYISDAESRGLYGGREKLMHELANKGYDGIIIDTDTWNDTNDEYSVTSKQYVVFNPENIKPA